MSLWADLWPPCMVYDMFLCPFRVGMSVIAVDLWPPCMVYDMSLCPFRVGMSVIVGRLMVAMAW